MKHEILFLAANPPGTDRLALDEECAAIERELRLASGRNDFDFRSRWAVSVDELMRYLNELRPTVLHFSGHAGSSDVGARAHGGAGIFLLDEGGSRYVSERALAKLIASAAPSTRVVVLNRCFRGPIAESLRDVVDCVVGVDGAIEDAVARSFAVSFYRALGHRRSVGNAVAQAAATLAIQALPGPHLVCMPRNGVDADRLFLSAPAHTAPAGRPGPIGGSSSKVDIGILTIRDDEFRAVLGVFADRAGTFKGAHREYALCHADAGGGARYTVAVLRQVEQGNGEAQDAARDLIDDLAPALVLVVGIAGGLPSDDVKLGDVVISTRIHDFTVEARKAGAAPTYATSGGAIGKALAAAVANLAAREDELGTWTDGLPVAPPVTWTRKGQLYGPKEWQSELRAKLKHHYPKDATPRPPVYIAGTIASSDRLVKDPELLFPWISTARDIRAVEMESGGVYRAARERCPMLAIRGISDLVGLSRDDGWTKFACAAAAAFTRAYLRTRPVPVNTSSIAAVDAPAAPPSLPRPVGLIDFTAERARHVGFVGRTAVLAQLDQLLIADNVDRWVVVTGGPGTGKSALLAAWLARCEAAGVAVLHHFIRRGEYDWDDPAKLVGSLVAQLALRYPAQREPETEACLHPAARLDAALRRVAEQVPHGRLVVLIDGLDEYDPPASTPGRDPLAAFLPRTLPRGVSLLCASRPRYPYVDMLAARGAVQVDLDNESAFAADNTATVRAFWEQAAPALGLDERFVAEAVECAVGNLQHAAMLRLHLQGLAPAQRSVERIPRGLAASLASAWERIAIDQVVVDGLGLLCAAREALTLDELAVVADWTVEAHRRTFVRGARELLVEHSREGTGASEYRLHHDSIREHIVKEIGLVAMQAHHRAIAHRFATWPAPRAAAARRYALRHALTHRAHAGAWDEAWRLAADMGFLEAKSRELGVHEAEVDVARVAERCRFFDGDEVHERFEDLARALGRESHWLRAAPDAAAGLVWNRLRMFGWSDEELDRQLRLPAGARFLRVRHVATRESPALVRSLVGHTHTVLACAVTPDGRRVVSASVDHTLKVWDLETGRERSTLRGHTGWVFACAVTPDGRHVVSASFDQTLKVWDLETGVERSTLKGHEDLVHACGVTPDGRRVVSASADRTLKVWDLETGRQLSTLHGHIDRVLACAVAPDGRRVVSASKDGTLKVWDLEAGQELSTLRGHAAEVNGCAVTPDGRQVISASEDHTLKVWDLETGQALSTLTGHAAEVNGCAVTSDGRRVISASKDNTLKVWDLAAGRELSTLAGHAIWVNACAMTPDGRRVVSASDDLTLKVWDLETARELPRPGGHAGWVVACAVTPNGRSVVSASDDMTLKVWSVETGCERSALAGHVGAVNACAVTPDGQRVVSASSDRTLKVWDLETGRELATLVGHAAEVNACAVTRDGQRVVSASSDRTLKVWDLESGRELATLRGHGECVNACALTIDGQRVVSASNDSTLKVWDLETERELLTLEGHTDFVGACAVTPDGRQVISAADDHTLKVWDLDTGRELSTLGRHADWVRACAVTPDGRWLVSASEDQTLKVWDLGTGACLFTHRASTALHTVAVTATTIIAGDVAGSVWFLDVPPSATGPR